MDIIDIPAETWIKVFSFMDDGDLIKNVQLVCFWFYQLVRDDTVWKPRWKSWKHNGSLLYYEPSYNMYIELMLEFKRWLINLYSGGFVKELTDKQIVIGAENMERCPMCLNFHTGMDHARRVNLPVYVPYWWVNEIGKVTTPSIFPELGPPIIDQFWQDN
jgi:F-box-like